MDPTNSPVNDTRPLAARQQELLAQLAASRVRLIERAQAGALDLTTLRELADREADLAITLVPMPIDPAEHVKVAHWHARPYLERLAEHDPAREVVADASHSYTPRKILRRVLDHALDHLNQIDQWLLWQTNGTTPVPTDGWAGSAQTLGEDRLPLTAADLAAWLWRINLTIAMVAQHAAQLSDEQLDWTPPDGGWTLRQMLHHLASAELYYAVWMDESLPDETIARYLEASRRLERRAYQALIAPENVAMMIFDDDAQPTTVTAIIHEVLQSERKIRE
jgi:hypothetical protein